MANPCIGPDNAGTLQIARTTRENFVKALFEQDITCCGHPMQTTTGYNFESNYHFMESVCPHCNGYKKIKAAPATANSENGQVIIPN